MATRSVRLRDFAIGVEIPDRVAQSVRRFVGPRFAATAPVDSRRVEDLGGGLFVAPPPEGATPRWTDPEVGVGFIRQRIDRRRAVAADDRSDAAAVARQPWYHTIELPDGANTHGIFDHRRVVEMSGIPKDLTAQTVLDVATADGYWAFEFERRGAVVTALDIDTTDDVDLPPRVRERASAEGLVDSLADGFTLAHRLLGSSVTRVSGSLYELDPDRLGRFDLVHSGDVLVHLRDPILALQQIHRVTGGMALLTETFDPALDESGGPRGLAHYLGGSDTAGWWIPSLSALLQMIADAGFSQVRVLTTYSLALRNDSHGPWRAVVEARP